MDRRIHSRVRQRGRGLPPNVSRFVVICLGLVSAPSDCCLASPGAVERERNGVVGGHLLTCAPVVWRRRVEAGVGCHAGAVVYPRTQVVRWVSSLPAWTRTLSCLIHPAEPFAFLWASFSRRSEKRGRGEWGGVGEGRGEVVILSNSCSGRQCLVRSYRYSAAIPLLF